MKNKVLFVIIGIIFIIAIIMTLVKGISVDTFYGEGYTISFTEKNTIDLNEIEKIVKEIWGNSFSVQRLEFFNDSAKIKVKDYTDEQITKLKDKLNEQYNSELEETSFKIEHVSNVKIRNVITPYVIPVILSLVIVMLFYAIRFRGAKKMIELLFCLLVIGGLFYSIIVIARIPFSAVTMPLAMCVYILTVLGHTSISEIRQSNE
ncbi:MAG: hypothetical protein IKG14_02750 [Clostridia bacterium]|nr:hypothetical protein [Clostridia bacterium]